MTSRNLARRSRSLMLPVTVAGVCGGLFAVVYVLTVRTTDGRLVSDAALRGAIDVGPGMSDAVDRVLDVVSVASLLGAVAVIAVIALIRLRRGMGLAAIALMVGANVSAQVLKQYVLVRPDLGLDEIAPATLNSLPSGHSTAAFSAVAALLFVVPSRLRLLTAAMGGVYVSLTAVATMLAGWHRAADSLAAFLLVGIWAGLLGAIVVLLDRNSAAEASAASRPGRRVITAIAGLLITGLALALLLVADGSVRESAVGPTSAFAAGILLLVGSATAVLSLILAVVQRIAPAASSLRSQPVESASV